MNGRCTSARPDSGLHGWHPSRKPPVRAHVPLLVDVVLERTTPSAKGKLIRCCGRSAVRPSQPAIPCCGDRSKPPFHCLASPRSFGSLGFLLGVAGERLLWCLAQLANPFAQHAQILGRASRSQAAHGARLDRLKPEFSAECPSSLHELPSVSSPALTKGVFETGGSPGRRHPAHRLLHRQPGSRASVKE